MPGKTKQGRQRCWASRGVKHSSCTSVAISLLLRKGRTDPCNHCELRSTAYSPWTQISSQPAFHGRNWGRRCSRSHYWKLSWTTTTTTNKTRNFNPGQTRRIACQSSPGDANVGGSSLSESGAGKTLMRWPGT
ncbi:hypothetical protein BO85DRAFT_463983 [Aspergillus piperis CBS 112811]|uniref:Uncharacterized protein n=1 Tax=Aspergillus piperis CBS 112811 TaxID=1448313 RepID=A0A8G1QRD3_9EURO|nr:hypothetical protein BO85DRAFT_463983 [Aspergillus piperis CBS 112811]RAH52408.1 hypothetical protein BO85DRAFT_463983 [Aspergillus piperis CBS 112811]